MGATTTGWSQRRVSWEKTCAGLGAVKVMTASAGNVGSGMEARVSSAGQPEGRSMARMGARLGAVVDWIQWSAASGRPRMGGVKPVPSDGVNDEVGVQRGLMLGEGGFVFDDGDAAVGGVLKFAPGFGGVALDAVRASRAEGR